MNTQARTIAGLANILQGYDISAKVYGLVQKIEGAMSSADSLVKRWVRNSTGRKELARLNFRMLEDIGLTEADVAKEIRKPFWKS